MTDPGVPDRLERGEYRNRRPGGWFLFPESFSDMLTPAPDEWTIFEAAHLLRRAGFGGSPDEIRKFHALGRGGAVESLLEPDEAPDAFPLPEWAEPERAAAEWRERLAALRGARSGAAEMTPEQVERARRETQQKYQRQIRRQGIEAQDWWFRRMLQTRAPLREKMTLFWHDHFATSIQKVRQPALLVRQNELFRRHAFGSFKGLTREIVRDPAMALYLDVQNSRKGRPNENFARELLELFTLGEGHYSEADIKEAARALTGYRIDRLASVVRHNRRQWDAGKKTIFGETGRFDGDGVVDLIFGREQAARYVPVKLWEFFVAENPGKETVDALAARFRAAEFRVGPVLRGIFLSKAFYAEEVMRDQIKCPVQYLVQMLKELELADAPQAQLLAAQQQLGQALFMPPNVAGWDWGKAWINTNTLLSRYNIAGFITKGSEDPGNPGADGDGMMAMEQGGGMLVRAAMRNAARRWQGPDYEKIAPRPLREEPAELVDALMFRFFQAPLDGRQRETFIEYAKAKKGAIFTNREVGELCHLMLSTPYYQLA